MSMTTGIVSSGLPKGVRRDHLMDLVERLMRPLQISHTAVLYLRALARTTAHADWHEEGRGPVSYVRQRDLSEQLGIDRRTANRIEALLERLGFLKILRLDNNHRSGRSGRDGETGVFLAPLIEKFDELSTLHETIVERNKARKRAYARASVARGELRRAIADEVAPEGELAAAKAIYTSTPAHLAKLDDINELHEIADRLKSALTALQEANDHVSSTVDNSEIESSVANDSVFETSKLSHERGTEVPHPIHTTYNSINVDCNTQLKVRAVVESADTDESGSNGLGDKPAAPPAPGKPEHREIVEEGRSFARSEGAKMPPAALYRAAGAEFRMYVDGRCGDHGASYSDIIFAADIRRRELCIRDAAWDAAGDALGYVDRAAAILVLDRNADHPTRPVKKPGGALIGMVKKARTGELRLTSSIIGILERTLGDGA